MSLISSVRAFFTGRTSTEAERPTSAAETTAPATAAEGWTAKAPRRPPSPEAIVRHAGKILDDVTDFKNDGAILGGDGLLHAPTADLTKVPPVLPNNGAKVDETIIFINGIMTDLAMHREDLQALANTGAAVLGVRNATKGMALDLLQCVGDKLDLRMAKNGAVTTASNAIFDAVKHGRKVTLVGHSQGALILSRAISEAQRRLVLEEGLTNDEAKKRLGVLKVETLGGSAMRFPDGPSYTHFINKRDLIGQLTGVGIDAANPWGRMGEGARVQVLDTVNDATDLPEVRNGLMNFFARFVDRTVHGTIEVYFKQRRATK